ncbi:MAG: DUF2115 family protein [Lachnospiraceae bacterium]|nr:DUF2115 family protein [Lachnospiraceae bacterium]
MTKSTLAGRIIKSIENDEWKLIQDESSDIPISEHNRKVLLELRETGVSFFGEVDDKDITVLSEAVYEFLRETWPEQSRAHKYVVDSCLVLTFLREEPMHPQEAVKYRVAEKGGKKEYYCPAKQDSVICNFCVSKKEKP